MPTLCLCFTAFASAPQDLKMERVREMKRGREG